MPGSWKYFVSGLEGRGPFGFVLKLEVPTLGGIRLVISDGAARTAVRRMAPAVTRFERRILRVKVSRSRPKSSF